MDVARALSPVTARISLASTDRVTSMQDVEPVDRSEQVVIRSAKVHLTVHTRTVGPVHRARPSPSGSAQHVRI